LVQVKRALRTSVLLVICWSWVRAQPAPTWVFLGRNIALAGLAVGAMPETPVAHMTHGAAKRPSLLVLGDAYPENGHLRGQEH
jgi:hypothetical protein